MWSRLTGHTLAQDERAQRLLDPTADDRAMSERAPSPVQLETHSVRLEEGEISGHVDATVIPPTAPPPPPPQPIDWSVVDELIRWRTHGTTSAEDPDDFAASDELLFRTFREYQKGRDFRVLFAFIIGTAALAFICFANRVDFDALRSNYFVQEGLRQTGRYEEFRLVQTVPAYYAWLQQVVDTVFDMPPGGRSTPVGFLLLRQLRRNIVDACGNSSFASFGLLGAGACIRDTRNTTVYPGGEGEQWYPNRYSSRAVRAQDIGGHTTDMAHPDDQFEVVFPLYHPDRAVQATLRAAAKSNITDLQTRGFFDERTSALALDMLFFHPTLKRYSRVTFLTEQLRSQYLLNTFQGTTFKLLKRGGTVANLTLMSDVVLGLFVMTQIVELIHSLFTRYLFVRSVTRAALTTQHFLSLMIAGMIGTVLGYRIGIWATLDKFDYGAVAQRDLGQTYTAAMAYEHQRSAFHDLSQTTRLIDVSYELFALALIPIAIKMLLYFQDVRGFNIIHRTLYIGFEDLMTVLGVAYVGLCFFAIAGNVFFGGLSEQFLTATVSFSTLCRLLVSADPGIVMFIVQEMPRVGSLYFGLFFFCVWLVLLNFVLGIIVSGVSTAMAEANDATRATHDSFRTVIVRYLLMTTDEYLRHRDVGVRCAANLAAGSAVAVLPDFFERCRVALRQQQNLSDSVVAVASYAQRNPAVDRHEAYRLLAALPEALRRRIFEAARSTSSAEVSASADLERQSYEVTTAVKNLDRAVRDAEHGMASPAAGSSAVNDGWAEDSMNTGGGSAAVLGSFTNSYTRAQPPASKLTRSRKFNLVAHRKRVGI